MGEVVEGADVAHARGAGDAGFEVIDDIGHASVLGLGLANVQDGDRVFFLEVKLFHGESLGVKMSLRSGVWSRVFMW